MTVGDRWGIAPMPHILWGQLPPLSPPPHSTAYAPYLIGPQIITIGLKVRVRVVSLGTPHSQRVKGLINLLRN